MSQTALGKVTLPMMTDFQELEPTITLEGVKEAFPTLTEAQQSAIFNYLFSEGQSQPLPEVTISDYQLLEGALKQREQLVYESLTTVDTPHTVTVNVNIEKYLDNIKQSELLGQAKLKQSSLTDEEVRTTVEGTKTRLKQYIQTLDNYLSARVWDNYDLDDLKWNPGYQYGKANTLILQFRRRVYDIKKLSTLIELSPTLPQCIGAMVRNVMSTGLYVREVNEKISPQHRPSAARVIDGPGDRNDERERNLPEILKEYEYLNSIVLSANVDSSLFQVVETAYTDYVAYGEAYVKVRFAKSREGEYELIDMVHLPSVQMFILVNEVEATSKKSLGRGHREHKITVTKNYKIYAHAVPKYDPVSVTAVGASTQAYANADIRYYSEYGCPYSVDPMTSVPKFDSVNEEYIERIIHLKDYNDNSSYGKPRWISKLGPVIGQIEGESLNLDSFSQNLIPNLVVLMRDLQPNNRDYQNFIQLLTNPRTGGLSGSSRKVAVLRTTSNQTAGVMQSVINSQATQIQRPGEVSFQKLNDVERKEILFGESMHKWGEEIRSSFCLPPIIIGQTSDYTYATAKESLKMAEKQVFSLERHKLGRFINHQMLGRSMGQGPKYHEIVFETSSLDDKVEAADFLNKLLPFNMVTPNMAIDIFNEYSSTDADYIEGGDKPIIATYPMNLPATLRDNITRGESALNTTTEVSVPDDVDEADG